MDKDVFHKTVKEPCARTEGVYKPGGVSLLKRIVVKEEVVIDGMVMQGVDGMRVCGQGVGKRLEAWTWWTTAYI